MAEDNKNTDKQCTTQIVRQRLINCVINVVGDIEEKDNVFDEMLDDLILIEIIMEVEDEFNVSITEIKSIDDFETIKDLIDWLRTNVA